MRYLVTEYDGVEDWLQKQGIDIDKRVSQISDIDLVKGDHVIGQLSIQFAKHITCKKAVYQHIDVNIPENIAAEDVTAELLTSLDAKLDKTYISLSGEGLLAMKKKHIKDIYKVIVKWFEELERKPFGIWFYTTASLLSFAWFGDMFGGSHLFAWAFGASADTNTLDLGLTLVSFLCYVFFSWQLVRVGRKLLPPIRKLTVTDNNKPKQVLIHTLSRYSAEPVKNEKGEWQLTLSDNRVSNKSETITFSGDLEADIQALERLELQRLTWNGTQLLRALKAHIGKVELILLLSTRTVGSRAGSHEHVDTLKQWLAQYVDEQGCIIRSDDRLIDPINVAEAYETLNEILSQLITDNNFSEKQLCVDITGATAAVSAACAMATLHTQAQFQYVTTDGSGKVYQQDLAYITSPAKLGP